MALKRELQLWEVVLAGVGVIVGAGIYALLGKGAGLVGGSIWLSFGIGGIIALMTGLSYAELSSRYPKAGAEYVYAKHSFGELVARLCGFALLVVGFTSAATVALGFGGYLNGLLNVPIAWGATFVVGVSFLILLRGAKFTTDLAGIISLVEITGLLVVIFIGLPTIAHAFVLPPIGELPTVLYGTAIVFFAFLGFEELVRMSEEMKDAKKKMPKALIAAVVISSILYVLVALSALGLVGTEELGKSSSPLATVVKPKLGDTGFLLMGVAGLLSTFNTVLLIILASSRLLYGMSVEKSVPTFLSVTKNHEPLYALGVVVILTFSITLFRDITLIAQITDALLFGVFAIMNGVVIHLHQKNQSFDGFKVPFSVGKIPIPSVIGLLASVGMLAFVEQTALIYSAGLFVLLAAILHVFSPRK